MSTVASTCKIIKFRKGRVLPVKQIINQVTSKWPRRRASKQYEEREQGIMKKA